jgi:hypothetical protein
MSSSENSKTIDKLSHEISVEVLRNLERRKKIGKWPLSTNYHCEGTGYNCGGGYDCIPKVNHSCASFFVCRSLYMEGLK